MILCIIKCLLSNAKILNQYNQEYYSGNKKSTYSLFNFK